MVYETDFYTTRRPYSSSRPTISSYSVTTPRYYSVTDSTGRTPRMAEQQYNYSHTTQTETRSTSGDRYGRPSTTSSSSTTERRNNSGPGGYSYNTERTSTTGGGPGGYSYSSTTSGTLPYGTKYRHYSYRV